MENNQFLPVEETGEIVLYQPDDNVRLEGPAEYRQNEFMVYATISQHGDAVTTEKTTEKVDEFNLSGKEPARSWQGVRRGLQYSKGYR